MRVSLVTVATYADTTQVSAHIVVYWKSDQIPM